MKARTALILAIVCAAAAVALVAADTAYSLTATLEARQPDGSWKTVSTTDQTTFGVPHGGFGDCNGPDLRVVVHNGRLIATSVDVVVRYVKFTSGGSNFLNSTTVNLERSETAEVRIHIPASAFEGTTTPGGSPAKNGVSVMVRIDGLPQELYATCFTGAA